ncbi:ABC-three component system middle component 1 [Acinetobacter tandoii]|uniref:ABC-three component system middle component 1 n=1 Tax=Acinetobacter tandoii TaxID=202954 RepID=UPI0030186447
MKLLNEPKKVEFLDSEFQEFKFELYSSYIEDKLFISCIVCWSNSIKDTITRWSEVQSILSLNYKSEREYARWNTYLIFLNEEKIPINEKYRIENDKFSARKIILDGLVKLPTISEVEQLINIELLGEDMYIINSESLCAEVSTLINPSIYELIKDVPLDSAKESKNIRSNVLNVLFRILN